MQQPTQTTKNPPMPTPTLTREQIQEAFRQHLRQADKLIKEQQFALANVQLAEAKKLEPTNPFIVAFEERLSLFEKGTSSNRQPQVQPVAESQAGVAVPPSPFVEESLSREVMEERIRQKVEEEYKARFTKELRRAEEHAAKILEEERSKLKLQQQVLKSKYEHKLAEIQQRYETEYHKKLEEETAHAEERLREQFQAKLDVVEEELKAQISLSYETKLRELEERLKREREEILAQERVSFQEREREMKERFDRQLLEALRKAESVFHEQSLQQQQVEKEQVRQQLAEEFHAALQKEREAGKLQYDALKKKIEESFLAEQQKLKEDHRRQLEEELQTMRRRETEEFERKRIALRQELENEFRGAYQQQIEAERQRVHEEAEKTIEAEKQRLHDEYTAKIEKQEANIRNLRTTIQREMEQNFLKRMEQISNEYDYKMELLGTKIPQTSEEKAKLYRKRLRESYQYGQPTVDEARKIMALKELLELTFDEHLAIEADVRLDLYVEHVERKIMSGEVDIKNPGALDELKQQYRITAEESAKLEPYILSSFQRVAVKGRILLADDDLMLLQSLDSLLTDSGYQVVQAESVEQALEALNTTAVDLVLSDIKFHEDQLDGFQFFISVQAQPHLRKIPFIFMSALRDGVIIRSGVQLGVDDYLTKPVDPDLLIAVIEGKLKRYRNLLHD